MLAVVEYGLPALYAVFVWWFSTGLLFYLDGLPRHTFRWSMLGATAVLATALCGLAISGTTPTMAGAYLAFTCGVLVWGWLEMGFLMGFLTGPRKVPCPRGCGGWRHFGHAVQAILYHELTIIVCAGVIVAVTWDGANQVGAWTFMILWGMRQSAKLNLFLGVRNLSAELLPEHLQYLRSFFKRRAMNLLFPFSVTSATVFAALLMERALATDANAFETVGLVLLATLLVLAILEHWLLVLPLPVAALWAWSLRSRAEHSAGEDESKTIAPVSRGTTRSCRPLATAASSLPTASG